MPPASSASPAASSSPASPTIAASARTPAQNRKLYVVHRRAAAALPRVRRQPLRARGHGDDRVRRRRASRRTTAVRRRRRSSGTAYRSLEPRRSKRTRGRCTRGRELAERAGRHRAVLRVARRRRAVSELHARARRERPARRPQPRLLRGAEPAAADDAARRGATIRRRSTGYPEFFLAHELAHQWWGQAVGWRNYHEQWLSEGFAQYFAALYAQHQRGDETFAARAAADAALGHRAVGSGPDLPRLPARPHPQREPRVPRARLQQGRGGAAHAAAPDRRRARSSAASAASIATSRFQKAGTDDLRAAMEAEAGRPLERFFERWIYGSTLPRLTARRHRVETAATVVLHVEQIGERLRPAGHRRRCSTPTGKSVDVVDPGHRSRRSTSASPLDGVAARRRDQQGRRHARRGRQDDSA